MWTPKRVLLLFGGLAFFLAGYGVYAFFLGGIDGLSPLPIEYWPTAASMQVEPPLEGSGDLKLQIAFGKSCPEVYRPIKVDLPSKGWGMAANQFDILPDGRVRLTPFSGYLFPKSRAERNYPEVHAVQCEEAFLTLDRPISRITEMSNRKVIGIELRGNQGITVVNNRGTPEKSDDIELRITNASLFYDQRRNLIWTEGYVQLLDLQSRPHPTKITAKGMDLFLTKDASTVSQKQPVRLTGNPAKGETVNGVEMLVLRSNVGMHLFVDAQSGFLGGRQEGAKQGPRSGQNNHPAKSKVVIRTEGPFTYDLVKDLAWFDTPPAQGLTPVAPEQVLLAREHDVEDPRHLGRFAGTMVGLIPTATPAESALAMAALLANRIVGKKLDHLLCDHLELQFRRKGAGGANNSVDKEIESARATARPGANVVLTMDTENLEAFAAELVYFSPTATAGPRTVLKGSPLHAVKDAHKITCQELHLAAGDKNSQGQQALAKGPGQIDLFDKANKQRPYPMHALWKETLTYNQDKDDGHIRDLLTLTGDACFVDEEHKQELHAQRLQVWLESGSKPANTGGGSAKQLPFGTSRQKPTRVEAFERVLVFSPELVIKRSHHLKIHFVNDLPVDERLPDTSPRTTALSAIIPAGPNKTPSAPTTLTANTGGGKVPAQPAVAAPPPANIDSPGSTLRPPTTLKSGPPIELEATDIVAYLIRNGSKNQLQELVCEGQVHVRQESNKANDKGLAIQGDMLNLLHHPQGDILFVFGNPRQPSHLQLGQLTLQGPKVTINQRDNTAEVEGKGAMTLPPSDTTFDGGKPTKAGTRLTVHWSENMLFNGKFADFHGNVEAFQDTSSLRCQTLQVMLNRVVSFKEGQKGGQNAKVEKLVCNQKVMVLDITRDLQGKLQRYHRLETRELTMDNQEGPLMAPGPGKLYLLTTGAADPLQRGPASKLQGQPAEQQLQLTRIDFEGRLFANTKDHNRIAKFYDNVEVFHLPADNPDVAMNPDRPPPGGFYLRCDLLTVYSKPMPNGKAMQEMRGERKVFFRSQDFFGRADVIKYDESQEQVIFEGGPGTPATLWQTRNGLPPREIKGSKILYNRRTGVFFLDGGKVITSWQQQPARAWEASADFSQLFPGIGRNWGPGSGHGCLTAMTPTGKQT